MTIYHPPVLSSLFSDIFPATERFIALFSHRSRIAEFFRKTGSTHGICSEKGQRGIKILPPEDRVFKTL